MAKFYLLLICLVVCLASVLGSGQSAYSFRVNHAMASDMDNTEWKSEEIYSVDVEPSLSTRNSGGALKLAPVLLAGTAAKLAMSHPAAKSQRMPKPEKIEVIVEPPKPKKVTLFRFVEETVVDKMAVLVTGLTVLSEGVLSFLLLEGLEQASKRISSEGLRNLATLAAWAALVFGAGELLGSLPARLVGRGRAASLAQARAMEARLRRPAWAPSPGAMQVLDFLSRASQVPEHP
uniref:ABC transmembrane type-1 domain-containing protein n=1 Tax=Heterosigma akashiwo TaxID=2829 RepID=A0A7S3XUX5_HETAK